MHLTIILWDLAESDQTVASLRSYLRDYAVEAYSATPGLRQKVWVANTGPEGETWGAVYLWDDEKAAYGRPPGVSRVVELIGYAPTQRSYFSVEAGADGPLAGALAGLGLAFTDPAAEPMRRPMEFNPPGASAFTLRADVVAGSPKQGGDGR
uniref:NocA n=1 Tax=Nocardia sp. ATCC 202099 TaxID=930400 RepID=E5DUG5_9NOCA|nr:NocA [Nocardia sp. ATCC 202099]